MRRLFSLSLGPAHLRAAVFTCVAAGVLSTALDRTAAAQPRAKPVVLQTWSLKNGLEVVFAGRQGAPIVSVQIVYHVGSRDEEPGTRGLARMMRELMFRGSARVQPGGHNQLMARIGGRAGAHIDEDVTSFYNTLPSPYLGLALELEADRMRALTLTNEAVAAAQKVVINTRQRQVDGSALGKSIELLRGEVFRGHAYVNGVAGAVTDLRRITPDDCRRFYRTYFTASNATLVVAGAASSAQVRALVEAHFGSLPTRPVPSGRDAFSAQPAGAEKALRLPIERPMVAMGAPLPRLSPLERASMLVLAEVLGGGSAGRLTRRLVGSAAPALAASAAPMMLQDGGMWVFFAVHQPARSGDEVRRSLLDELAGVRDKPIELPELIEARLRASAAAAERLSTAEGLATALGEGHVLQGSAELALLLPQALLDVTQSDVGRVANQYLSDEAFSILRLTPEGRVLSPAGAP